MQPGTHKLHMQPDADGPVADDRGLNTGYAWKKLSVKPCWKLYHHLKLEVVEPFFQRYGTGEVQVRRGRVGRIKRKFGIDGHAASDHFLT